MRLWVAAASASLPMVCPFAIGKAFGLAAATPSIAAFLSYTRKSLVPHLAVGSNEHRRKPVAPSIARLVARVAKKGGRLWGLPRMVCLHDSDVRYGQNWRR